MNHIDERLLREGLRVNPLTPEAMARIRAATEAEWGASVAAERRPRRWRIAIAASVLLALTVGAFFAIDARMVGEHASELSAHIVRVESPGIVEVHSLRRATPVPAGAMLRSGERYRAAGQALLALESGGNLRVAAGSEFEILAKDDYRLDRGELYVDIPPGTHAGSAFIARTAAGEFRHLGTQFALAVDHDETRLRVREGSVRWRANAGESTVEAGNEVVFSGIGKTAERPIDTSGTAWDWTTLSTPDFEIEGRPLEEFLEWVARESGRKLVLADDQARKEVGTIRMHGSVRGLAPLQALSAVMAATELRYDLPDGQIRVSFAGDAAPRT